MRRQVRGRVVNRRGDTIVEVTLAFVIFSLVAILTLVAMNRGIAVADTSLEITLVREQIDSQAEMMRYARNTNSGAWSDILAAAGTDNQTPDSNTVCPDTAPSGAFIMNSNESTKQITYQPLSTANFKQPSVSAKIDYGATPVSEGIWLVPVKVNNDSSIIDVYIRACWYPPASNNAQLLQTIVRLYET
jgi:type II secretory pathway pseudopilin PulG